jgi:hypothetical protein
MVNKPKESLNPEERLKELIFDVINFLPKL